ncbi:MAG: arsenic efflux protein [Clostridia bacterium]|nr:arsenic efflux protein [Clostridia bacterium]
MIDALLDALLDTLKLVPWLLVMHVLIEVFEYHAVSKIKLHKVLRGKWAPLIGGACGILPQCGFGVVAADLYSRRSIRLGTLFAVFIATSDEAVPILLSAPTAQSLAKLGVLLGCKLAVALIAGYALNFLLRKRELTEMDPAAAVLKGCHRHELGEHSHEHEHGRDHADERKQFGAHSEEDIKGGAVACADEPSVQKKQFDFKCFVLHPLLHTLTVAAYILAVNAVFAVALYYVGEARLESFLTAAKWYQPLLAGLLGLVPNCAGSVVLAQMFARGSITLGAAVAGLSVNAGIGLAVLLRKNRPAVHNVYIMIGLYAYSVAVGLLLTLAPM